MSEAVVPGLDDPQVRVMAEGNHVPGERWVPIGRVFVECEQCRQSWPCATRRALDRFEFEQQATP